MVTNLMSKLATSAYSYLFVALTFQNECNIARLRWVRLKSAIFDKYLTISKTTGTCYLLTLNSRLCVLVSTSN